MTNPSRGDDGGILRDDALLDPITFPPAPPTASLGNPVIDQALETQPAPPKGTKPKRTTTRKRGTQTKRPASSPKPAKRTYSGTFAEEAAALAATHAAEYHGYAETLREIADYIWYDAKQTTAAQHAFRAATVAVKRGTVEEATFSMITDTYNYDRAIHAAKLRAKPGVKPIRIDDTAKGLGSFPRRETFTNWGERVPFEPSEVILTILADSPPDELMLVRPDDLGPDPYIYACYGDWYVKIAEWL